MNAVREDEVELRGHARPGLTVELIALHVGDGFSILAMKKVVRKADRGSIAAQRIDDLLGSLPDGFDALEQAHKRRVRLLDVQAENIGVREQLDDLPKIFSD